ncbi:alkaline phosphatase family protein [Fusibacter paucivorans]|uniref:Alkaline phosphatase family protein n=1 Tax=Fusibacter paucivorans TaxID=76009 RepID=A0ABS5PR95_9FIRM|nr:ectonucleotide pyrophosphatase/phosphodiesterase [Fusibacter paucivorans]MBS7526939.1 alkaline phosphatase family protein [Fusibacter paucivorans]
MPNKLIVLSFDALQTGDLDLLSKQPHFSEIFKHAAVVKDLHAIYPTLTYPIHTTIMTGVYPDKHGITHNQKFTVNPESADWNMIGSDWYWEKENVKVRTLPEAVYENGGTVATVIWPVMAGEKRWCNVPQIWPTKTTRSSARAIFENAASEDVMADYYESYIAHYDWDANMDAAFYAVDLAIDIIARKNPDLLMCHVLHLDHVRHLFGTQGMAINTCLKALDIIMGRFIKAVKDAGLYDQTNFVILGDHGQIPVENVFYLNKALKDMGLIKNIDNKMGIAYDAYSFSSGFSSQIFLRDNEDKALKNKVYNALSTLRTQYPAYIEHIYTKEEAEGAEHLKGDFVFVVEGTEGTLFLNEMDRGLVVSANAPDYKGYRATHGHHPSKGEKPPFIAFGPDIIEGKTISEGKTIDICPTLASLAGAEMPSVVGVPFDIIK